jgi:hypothetical protein
VEKISKWGTSKLVILAKYYTKLSVKEEGIARKCSSHGRGMNREFCEESLKERDY